MYRYHILYNLILLPLAKNFSKTKGGKTMFINYKKCNLKLCKKAKKRLIDILIEGGADYAKGKTMQNTVF